MRRCSQKEYGGVLPALKGRKWTTAIVVADPIQFGVSRQYSAFAMYYSKDYIFPTMAEEESWIGASGSPTEPDKAI
jgi:hypothetical protein